MHINELGQLNNVLQRPCTHYDERPEGEVSLLVIHNISLPAGQFATPYVDDLFMGAIDCTAHESFADLKGLRVSAHCFIRRTGEIIQYVPFEKRAWHAGISTFEGRERCNDFSVGIELEGTDTKAYTQAQYNALHLVTKALMAKYPEINRSRIVGHCDIAPGRKTDPGVSFDWQYYFDLVF
ncbi:1,6-anhydro-N-acetylmuramyl-L-alanine amidase AmpD [Pseudoalteromonas sp. BZP1]|uniref:1,6-anhydro-N-acetylmuramyl-L-alanine amidase AmpD n=1 Tax=unclassified Pseudoalteromonas TaxID=194690 RepID=UPI0032C45867